MTVPQSALTVSPVQTGLCARLFARSEEENLEDGRGSVKVQRPWGSFEQYTDRVPCTVKIIVVAPGGALSRQYHHNRDELWVVLDRGARVELDGQTFEPEVGEEFFIPREAIHRLSAVGESAARILEISFGEFYEEDIVRLEDAYGRIEW